MNTECRPYENTCTIQTEDALPAKPTSHPVLAAGLTLLHGATGSGRPLLLLDFIDSLDLRAWAHVLLVTTPQLARTLFAQIRHPRLRILWNSIRVSQFAQALKPETLAILHPLSLVVAGDRPECELEQLAQSRRSTILAIAPYSSVDQPTGGLPTHKLTPESDHPSAATFLLRALGDGELAEQELIARATEASIPLARLVSAGRALSIHRTVRTSRHSRHRVWHL
jgi:hypothetical protein